MNWALERFVVFLYMLLPGMSELPKNGLLSQVSPKDHLLLKVCIQSHCVPLLLHKLSVFLPLQAQATDITAIGEDEAGFLAYAHGRLVKDTETQYIHVTTDLFKL